ncbi:phosphopyruvate hydratase [archaeon 13_1_20CM_2_51_12]|nr:MAG: phosphopyruvate hydratase [Crenarchaeota archaeon 13_1_40CM_3_52_17]OLE70828.1 MAG: phosphopyruvate hydratase [archaeon 13_1_20CM_2_51_12]
MSKRTTGDSEITDLKARQVLDSRGNPTVEVDVWTRDGSTGRGTVPSGASTGIHEALELRDGDMKRFHGKGVLKAVSNVNNRIRSRVIGKDARAQREIDELMIAVDGTPNKKRLGANAILGVSMAVAKAAASSQGKPAYKYLRDLPSYKLPVPMMNVINGGKHAGNKLAVQEFQIEPVGASSCSEAIRIGDEVYHSLGSVLKAKYGPSAINVGDEGGYAPPLEMTGDALEAILLAISDAGYDESTVHIGIDAASSSFYNNKDSTYQLDGKKLSAEELESYYEELVRTYPIRTLEDPFDEDDYDDFVQITRKLGNRVKIIGDDLYVTNLERIKRGILKKATNAILIKLNQIGTVTETLDAIKVSKDAGLDIVVSHRSGETEDTFISHLATSQESLFIKTGAPARGERTAKYNELLRIEEELGSKALFMGSTLK